MIQNPFFVSKPLKKHENNSFRRKIAKTSLKKRFWNVWMMLIIGFIERLKYLSLVCKALLDLIHSCRESSFNFPQFLDYDYSGVKGLREPLAIIFLKNENDYSPGCIKERVRSLYPNADDIYSEDRLILPGNPKPEIWDDWTNSCGKLENLSGQF